MSAKGKAPVSAGAVKSSNTTPKGTAQTPVSQGLGATPVFPKLLALRRGACRLEALSIAEVRAHQGRVWRRIGLQLSVRPCEGPGPSLSIFLSWPQARALQHYLARHPLAGGAV